MPNMDPESALFLDFDGTLVDLAERPEAVVVAPGLGDLLAAVRERLGGALAIVSGRPMAQIDAFLRPLSLPAAGVHGTERRRADGTLEHLRTGLVDEPLVDRLQQFAAAHAGVMIERKTGAVAIHYRQAPQWEAACLQIGRDVVAATPALSLLHGKCVVELKSALAGKGRALTAFMNEAPFAGRRPVFVGDDTTDEAGFEAAQALGGIGIKVGAGPTVAVERLPSPAALHDWLRLFLNSQSAPRSATKARPA